MDFGDTNTPATDPAEQGRRAATILTVCSGNICRSPLAEQLLRARLDDVAPRVNVASAGTIADDGVPMDAQAGELSRRYGGDPEPHRSRLLNERQIMTADLVLTATRAHRAAVVSLVPRASRYTFTLPQFASLLQQLDDDELAGLRDLPALVEAAAAHRGFALPGAHADADDIEDPYRQHADVYERVGAQIDELVADIATSIRAVLR